MDSANHDRRIDYIEIPAQDVAASKQFYSAAFGWTYKDWGPEYADTNDGRLSSGLSADTEHPLLSPLVVIYCADLEAAHKRVVDAGGTITREIFSFPGGKRFHFIDPAGNELAVWTKA